MAETISPDYLVVGAGAMGMAFVDTMLSDSKATVAIVDRYARPGGHWTMAYPFVRLHQPSAFYGVNSRPLGENKIDEVGLNKGMPELATGDEVLAYYSKVMHQTFLPSGRITYYPKHDYVGEGEFRSIVTNKPIRVGPETKIVDATFSQVKVAAMGPPAYEVSSDVHLVTPNDLTRITRSYGGYTVIGAGKTGIDACIWLITNGVDPKDITWIMPRDSWFFDRANLPGPGVPGQQIATRVLNTDKETFAATSVEDFFLRLEGCGQLMRLDKNVWPTMFRCATISKAELEQVKRIGTIIRKGRVTRLEANQVTLQKGTYKSVPDTLYIDCSADPLAKLDPVPVFSGKSIKLQPIRHCQQVFSAAFIAHVESAYSDETHKNELCRAIPHPYESQDYLVVFLQTTLNGARWAREPKTAAWLKQARLDWYGIFMPSPPEDPEQAQVFYAKMKARTEAICNKYKQLIGQLPEEQSRKAMKVLAKF